jgi:hypothetical protein
MPHQGATTEPSPLGLHSESAAATAARVGRAPAGTTALSPVGGVAYKGVAHWGK